MLHHKHTLENILLKLVIVVNELKKLNYSLFIVINQNKILKTLLKNLKTKEVSFSSLP